MRAFLQSHSFIPQRSDYFIFSFFLAPRLDLPLQAVFCFFPFSTCYNFVDAGREESGQRNGGRRPSRGGSALSWLGLGCVYCLVFFLCYRIEHVL